MERQSVAPRVLSSLFCLLAFFLLQGQSRAEISVGNIPRLASPAPVIGNETAPSVCPVTINSRVSVPSDDVGKTAIFYLAVSIGNSLFLNSEGAWIPYSGGQPPAYMSNHTLAATEQTTLFSNISGIPNGTYGIFSAYQTGYSPLKFAGYFLSAGSESGSVCISQDAARSVKAVIPATGGSVTAVAADGTKFTLTVPADALLSDEEIMVTPVSGIDRLPLSGGMIASVKLAPEGLRLLEPATLTIERPSAIDSGGLKLVGFAYHGNGEGFHFFPSAFQSSSVTAKIMHFSGYGAGAGTQTEIENQRQQHPPSSPEDQANQNLDPAGSAEANYRYLLPWAMSVLAMAQTAATAGDADIALIQLEQAYTQYLAWLSTVTAFGLEYRFTGEKTQILNQLALAITISVQNSSLKCFTEKDPSQAQKIVRIVRWGFLNPDLIPLLGNADTLIEKARKCATFEMEMDSTVQLHAANGTNESHYRATVTVSPISLGPAGGLTPYLTGSGVMEFESETWPPADNCSFSFNPAGSTTATVPSLSLDLNIKLDYSADIVTVFVPGAPYVNMTLICPNYSTTSLQMDIWIAEWTVFHVDELDSGAGGYRIKDWTVIGGEEYATKSFVRNMNLSDGAISENTTFTLIHKPQM